MILRADYLDNHRNPSNGATFAAYYGQFLDLSAGSEIFARVRRGIGVAAIREAITKGSDLNTIPIATWEAIAIPFPAEIATAMRRCGDYPTLSGGVCLAKVAAERLVAEES